MLIYGDEEYDFKGIKRYVADEEIEKQTPLMTLSLDGDLAVATGCRGVIELNLEVSGMSGHASNPANGTNVVTETVAALQNVSQELSSFVDVNLGAATTNIAYLCGGVTGQDENGNTTWLREGNIIPDTAEVTFEVRTPTRQLDARVVVDLVERSLKARGLALRRTAIRHDIAPWPVCYDQKSLQLLRKAYVAADVPFVLSDRKFQGYIDAQMVVEKIPSPTFIIGTGGENKHGADENVLLEDIDRANMLYRAILKELLPNSQDKETI